MTPDPISKVFLATSVHRWDDIRVLLKEGVSLAKRYRVELHAPAPFESQVHDGVKIYGLPQWERVSDRRAIRREIGRRIRRSDAVVFHFHDPELIPLGLLVKLIYRKKVIYDVHEDYATFIRHKTWIPTILRYPVAFLFRLLEQLAARIFDHLITASPAIQRKFASRPATLISNYPLIDPSRDFPPKENGSIHFVYAGTMEQTLGIREMLLGFIQLTEHTSLPVSLQIAGWLKGAESYQHELRQLFKHPGIKYHGGLSFNESRELMRSCHIGLIPYLPSDMMLNLVSHKLFNYMEAGLAILASKFPGWPEDLLTWNIGLLFNPRNISSIAEVMAAAASAPDELEAKGRRAFQLVGDKFTWESQESRLFNAYEQVAG